MLFPLVGTNFVFKEDGYIESIDIQEKNFIFPLGTKIKINVIGQHKFYNVSWIGKEKNYSLKQPLYHIGVGIKDGKHVIFLSIYAKNAKVKLEYRLNKISLIKKNSYDFLIITPSSFYNEFKKLADFKEKNGIKTKVVTLEEIYGNEIGRDNAEKIKYYIKEAVEKYGIKYVLLAGSIYKLPIRYVVYHEERHLKHYNFSIPTDLYYADLYRYENGKIVFSSWDTNNNGIYGEVYYGYNGINDIIDLYPDVYIGRLACNNVFEAKIVVNKIIKYESNAYGKQWFKRMLLVGGDTFPKWGILEGEFMNEYIANMMKGFEPYKMWASKGNINAINVEANLEKGAGFLYYSGHGFPYGWATHKPNDENWTGRYFTPYIAGLLNGYKLPIMFFDACLTAKLDFNSSDLREDGVPIKINKSFPCFAWYFISHEFGGAIATIGATRVAFTGVDEGGPYAGASYLAYHFFSSYIDSENKKLGNIFANAQENYLNNLWDRWTLQEFILLGDPTLKIGGYE